MRHSAMALAMLWLMLVSAHAEAHPLAPLGVRLLERAGAVEVSLKRARVQPKGASFGVRIPAGCSSLGATVVEDSPAFVVERQRWRCPSGLLGRALGVDGLTEADVDAIVHIELEDGRVLSALLDRSHQEFVVPAAPSTARVVRDLVGSGAKHLVGGFDHLLFVLGLVLLVRRPRTVLLALTAFTVGHGVALVFATLGWVTVPPKVTEVAIAGTLLWMALEAVRRHRRPHEAAAPRAEPLTLRRPYLASLAIGLVHGLGFANAFSSAGLAGAHLALALGSFHVGVELGQAAAAFAFLLLIGALRTHEQRWGWLPAYGIGSTAVMWLIERTLALWA